MTIRLRDGDSIYLQASGGEDLTSLPYKDTLGAWYTRPMSETEFLVLQRDGVDMISLFSKDNRYVSMVLVSGTTDHYKPKLLATPNPDAIDFQYIRNSDGTFSFLHHPSNSYIGMEDNEAVSVPNNGADSHFRPTLIRGPSGERTCEDD